MRKSRRSPRRSAPRPALAALAGVLTVAAIAGFIYLAEESYNGLPFLSYRTVYATLPNVGHLQQHDPVDIAGVRVGQVLRTSTHANQALVELQLQGVGPLPVDSRVIVRADGLLGARYVELDPGQSRRMLPNGGTIVETSPTSTYTLGVSDALNLFDTPTRTALGEMINGLGQGVEGRGSQLNEAIQLGPTSGQDFDTAADAILARPGAAAAFLPAVNSAMSAFDSVRNQLADLLHPAAVSASAFASQGGAVDQTLSLAPSWERDVVSFGAPASRLLSAAGSLASASDAVLPAVPQALRSTASLLTQGGAPLRATKPVFDEVPRVTPAALSILSELRPDLSPLHQAFTKLVQPVSTLAIHGCDLQNWATAVRSLVNFGTLPGGHWGPDVGFPLSVVASPQEAHTAVSTGIPFPTENDYPAPCAYTPGATISGSTLLDVMSGVLR